jgi:glycosyltransferase involved in cell wall biosynthesis
MCYRNKKIGVVVPAFNEELLIGETLKSIPRFVDMIYVIDDCSTDRTAEIAKKFEKVDPRITCICHEKNEGVGAAITTGYKKAIDDDVDIAAVMAGDNQMDPAFLPDFLDPIIDGKADYTKGNRLLTSEFRKGMSEWRMFGNFILTFLTKIASGYWQTMDPQNGYTAISRLALKKINIDALYPRYGYCNNLLARLNVQDFRVMNVPHPAKYGMEKSKIKYGNYIIKVSFLLWGDFLWRLKMKYVMRSFHPLIIFYLFGTLMVVIGSFGGLYSLYFKLILHGAIFERGILSLIIFMLGLQFLLFAMVFDMQHENVRSSAYNDIDAILAMSRDKIDKCIISSQKNAKEVEDVPYSTRSPEMNL